jgi:hypothetical protein
MEQISQKQIDKAKSEAEEDTEDEKDKFEGLTEEKFNLILQEMQNPVMAQQRLAAQVKNFLDKRINTEMSDNGYLSDGTRRWVESYNNILEKIQKALHGDKSVSLHLHKVSHSDIAAKMREASEE